MSKTFSVTILMILIVQTALLGFLNFNYLEEKGAVSFEQPYRIPVFKASLKNDKNKKDFGLLMGEADYDLVFLDIGMPVDDAYFGEDSPP